MPAPASAGGSVLTPGTPASRDISAARAFAVSFRPPCSSARRARRRSEPQLAYIAACMVMHCQESFCSQSIIVGLRCCKGMMQALATMMHSGGSCVRSLDTTKA